MCDSCLHYFTNEEFLKSVRATEALRAIENPLVGQLSTNPTLALALRVHPVHKKFPKWINKASIINYLNLRQVLILL